MGHRDETMIAQTLSNVARPRVVARARATRKSTAARAQFGAVKGFDPLRVSPKARGNFQVVASVTKKPDLSDPVLRAKLAKGMGHNYYGEPAWPNDLLYIFPVVILGTIVVHRPRGDGTDPARRAGGSVRHAARNFAGVVLLPDFQRASRDPEQAPRCPLHGCRAGWFDHRAVPLVDQQVPKPVPPTVGDDGFLGRYLLRDLDGHRCLPPDRQGDHSRRLLSRRSGCRDTRNFIYALTW